MRLFILCLALCSLQACFAQNTASDRPLYQGQELSADQVLQTIAIGSCNRQDEPQVIWPTIARQQPDLWVWLGDNIYGDTQDMEVLATKYRKQKFHPAYATFRAFVPVIGIWDDHDYGVNDGDKNYPRKEASKDLMMDFLDVAPDAAVRQREGAYQSYTFGPKGKRVKIILLDGRYFRDPLQKSTDGKRRYVANKEGDLLGEAQWEWFESQLRDSEADVHIIGCGIQMISAEHGYEKWANFPRSRERLFELITKYELKHPLLISGDRHISELSMVELPGLQYPLYDLTASGMTHTWSSVGEEANQYRVSDLMAVKGFGLIRIDWSNGEPAIRVEVKDQQGETHLSTPLQHTR